MLFDALNDGRIRLLNKLGNHFVFSINGGQHMLQIERNFVKDDWIDLFEFPLKLS